MHLMNLLVLCVLLVTIKGSVCGDNYETERYKRLKTLLQELQDLLTDGRERLKSDPISVCPMDLQNMCHFCTRSDKVFARHKTAKALDGGEKVVEEDFGSADSRRYRHYSSSNHHKRLRRPNHTRFSPNWSSWFKIHR